MKNEFKEDSMSGFQLAGYASFDYENEEDGDGSFAGVKFSPILHYQHGHSL